MNEKYISLTLSLDLLVIYILQQTYLEPYNHLYTIVRLNTIVSLNMIVSLNTIFIVIGNYMEITEFGYQSSFA